MRQYLADAKEWSIQVSPKVGDNEWYGRRVTLSEDGTLEISGHDGLTRLSESEAIDLAMALLDWARVRV